MTDLYPYQPKSLEEMFSLRKGDIAALISSEGIPYYMTSRSEFVGYLPSLKAAFILDEETQQLCKKNLLLTNYSVTLAESVIKIASTNPLLPANSSLYSNLWKTEAEKLLDIDKNFALLISAREEVPVFCGHERFISRLADNFPGDTTVVNALDFIRKCEGQ